MSALFETAGQRSLDVLLRLIVTLEVLVYFGAALMHWGVRISLGPLVLGVPYPIRDATIVETILGLAVVVNLAALTRTRGPSTRITLGVHLFLFFGVLLGMISLVHFEGLPPSPNWNIHFVMLGGIAMVIALVLLRTQGKKA